MRSEHKRGRPRQPPQSARSNRIVTFVTDSELENLHQIAHEEDRSLSSVVHQIVSTHLASHIRDEDEDEIRILGAKKIV